MDISLLELVFIITYSYYYYYTILVILRLWICTELLLTSYNLSYEYAIRNAQVFNCACILEEIFFWIESLILQVLENPKFLYVTIGNYCIKIFFVHRPTLNIFDI